MSIQQRLASLANEARARSRRVPRRYLMSVVEKIADIDPLEALARVESLSATDPRVARFSATRMYWTRPVDAFTITGIGAAETLAPDGADRFATVDRDWNALIANALVDDPSGGGREAGPILMGGFAFDPEGPHSEEWSDFPAASLFVPSLQLLRSASGCWLTTTIITGDTAPTTHDFDVLARVRDAIMRDAIVESRSSSTSAARTSCETLSLTDIRPASDWRATVRDAVAAIDAGRIEKVVLAREVRAHARRDFDPVCALQQLRESHGTSYVFGYWNGSSAFIGATPERLVRVDGARVQASSLAGSVSRGTTPEHDASQAAALLASDKDRAEHEFVRRALFTGLARLCDEVTADETPSLLSLPNVHHLHTAVHARLRDGHTLLQLVAQLHPTPAVGGEPRNTALRFIREHEGMDRGWYAAPIGWLQRDRGEFAVALRSALIRGDDALMFAGCGVVADSDPDQEYAESLLKLRPMEAALAAACGPRSSSGSMDEASADQAVDSLATPCGGAVS